MAVSRETPPPPPAAREYFGSALPLADRYATWLCSEATVRGLIGPREVPRIWERHILNCAVLAEAIPQEALRLADLGSGAGLPGIPVALRRPELHVTLIEPLLRRTTFLERVVADLGLTRVEVVRVRAEDLHGKTQFDVVSSRAVAPLDRLARWSLPLVSPGGTMLAMKGSSAAEEVRAARDVVRRLGGAEPVVEQVGGRWSAPPVTVVRITRSS